MFMTNIPRRKITEKIRDFEERVIELQILIDSEENFRKQKESFNKQSLRDLKRLYKELKALLVMFLENQKHETAEDFDNELKYLLSHEKEVTHALHQDQNLPHKFKNICKRLDTELEKTSHIESMKEGKELYQDLDKFNEIIPHILTLRRDNMK